MSTVSTNPAASTPELTVATSRVVPLQLWVTLGTLFVAFVGLYFRWFSKQAEFSWDRLDDWGHAFVVPIIAGAMVYTQRDRLNGIIAKPFWPGLLPLALGIMCYFFFIVGVPNHMLQGLAMILCLSGVILLVLGKDVFRIAFLPLLYLLFGITISEQVMIRVTFQLQLLATQGAWLLLKVISLPGNWFMVDASGNLLEIFYKGRTIPLNVAEACSGMRMVIAFIALAGAIAVFGVKHWWQRIAVLLLAVPVALFMNIIRVAVLGLLSIGDVNLAAGNIHMLIGTLLLVPGMFLFLGAVWALKRIVVDPQEAAELAKKNPVGVKVKRPAKPIKP
ncbi:hypothetical protein LBMAG48_26130 [Phycisphaerae bacterium]|nr:hypothetical protein LBMAG48_26130 [Phycisphaerae bacterium]